MGAKERVQVRKTEYGYHIEDGEARAAALASPIIWEEWIARNPEIWGSILSVEIPYSPNPNPGFMDKVAFDAYATMINCSLYGLGWQENHYGAVTVLLDKSFATPEGFSVDVLCMRWETRDYSKASLPAFLPINGITKFRSLLMLSAIMSSARRKRRV